MTTVIFHACYWKKEVTAVSHVLIRSWISGGLLPVCFPLLVTCFVALSLCQPCWGLAFVSHLEDGSLSESFSPFAKCGPYLGRLLVPTSEELLVFLLLGDAPASLGAKEEGQGCPSLLLDNTSST